MKDIQEQLFEELKRAGLTKIAVVSDVVAAVGRDKHQIKLQGRLVELDLCYQATLADIAAERLKTLNLGKARDSALKDVAYWVQRAEEGKAAQARLRAVTQTLVAAVGAEGPCSAEEAAERVVARLASRYVAGRTSALAEIVSLLEDDRALIEQIEEIEP
jgi:hypothetical protein